MGRKHLKRNTEARFPRLKRSGYRVTSKADSDYNCFAYAAEDQTVHWYPTEEEEEGVFWPPGVDRKETLEAFIEAYKTKGYLPCEVARTELEPGYDKIAIYVGADEKPKHAARQLASGAWTSKLGLLEDIRHDNLSSLESDDPTKPAYWKVAKIMKRRQVVLKTSKAGEKG